LVSDFVKSVQGSASIVSLHTSPWVCRISDPLGCAVVLSSAEKILCSSTLEHSVSEELVAEAFCSKLFNFRFEFIGDLNTAALNCTNQIYHPPRAVEYLEEGLRMTSSGSIKPFFYSSFVASTFESMRALDEELYQIKLRYRDHMGYSYQVYNFLELERMQWGYDCETIEDLIESDVTLRSIPAPIIIGSNGGSLLDLQHRFVQDDIFNGLLNCLRIACRLNCYSPRMSQTILRAAAAVKASRLKFYA
jgi:hypothetical protein